MTRLGAFPAALFVGLTLASPAAAREPVKATATASKTEVAIGEPFVLEVAVAAPAGSTFTFPGEVLAEGFELRPIARPAGPAGSSPEPWPPNVQRYEGTVFALSEASIAPLSVKVQLPDGLVEEAATAPVALKVKTLLPKQAEEQKLSDIKGPLDLDVGTAFWIAIAVGFVLVAALVAFLWRRRRRPAAVAPAPPPVDPAAEALQALGALAAGGQRERGDYRAFYIALTAIAKRYFERRLQAPVMEMTTAETVAFLRQSERANGLAIPMRDLANAADQIKFAKGVGQDLESLRHLEAVRGMITVLEERFAPPPTAEKVA